MESSAEVSVSKMHGPAARVESAKWREQQKQPNATGKHPHAPPRPSATSNSQRPYGNRNRAHDERRSEPN